MTKAFLIVSVACNVWFLFLLFYDRIMDMKLIRFFRHIAGLWRSLDSTVAEQGKDKEIPHADTSMLSGITNTFSFCCVTVMFTVSTKTAIAFAILSLIASSVRRSVILVKSSVPSSSVMTFPACRISSILVFFAMPFSF
jgi:hypothetical protein